MCRLFATASVAALSLLRNHSPNLASDVTQTWVNTASDTKWRRDLVDALIRNGLLSISEFDAHVARRVSLKQAFPHATECALNVVRLC